MRYSEFKTEKEFKKFCRENKLTLKMYFEKFEPRYDLFTKKQIEFKDRKTYFETDFVDKRHMPKYLADLYDKEQVEYIVEKLKHRAEDKGWKFAPSQVECRSLRDIPALNVVDCCRNKKIWDKLGLPLKYQYDEIKWQFEDLKDSIIGIDSREQKPLSFVGIKTSKTKFDFGDYCFVNEPYFCNTFIERKSIQDLWGTISQGYDRFDREIERAKDRGGYIIVVVDYLFSKAQSYNYNKKYSKATSAFIFSRIREIMQTHDNVQFVFSGGRKQSIELIQTIGKLGKYAQDYDLQYCLDMKEI